MKNIKEKVEELGYKLLTNEEEIRGSKSHFRIEDKDGYIIRTTAESLIYRKSSQLRFTNNNPEDTLYNIKLWIKLNNKEFELLSDTYIKNHAKLKWRCLKDGHVWEASWASTQSNHGCPLCAGNIKHTLEQVKEKVKEINPDIEILSKEYLRGKDKLDCKCKKCGNEWKATWLNLGRGTGCPVCANNALKGSGNPSWKGGSTHLNKILRKNIVEWKKESMVSCDWKCVITGSKKYKIHHIYNFSNIMEEALVSLSLERSVRLGEYTDEEIVLINEKVIELHKKYGLGVCLEDSLHEEFHSIYGREDNTYEQFCEYYKFKTGRDFIKDYPQYNIK